MSSEYARPHWLKKDDAMWPLLRIAQGVSAPLTPEEAQAMLADWGELLGMVGEYVFKAGRLDRAKVTHCPGCSCIHECGYVINSMGCESVHSAQPGAAS